MGVLYIAILCSLCLQSSVCPLFSLCMFVEFWVSAVHVLASSAWVFTVFLVVDELCVSTVFLACACEFWVFATCFLG